MSDNKKELKQAIRTEFMKCAQDPVYFMRKYCYIQHPQKGKMLFDLFDFQEETVHQFVENDYNVILKARQLGISTLTAGYALWFMTFYQDKNILVIATKQEVAKNLVTKVRVMHANLPTWLKQTCIEDNKLSLRYKNGSQIKAVASSEEAGRSEALSLLILDEAAFIDKIDTIWTAASQTLALGGRCIALSTPNGVGNWFHRTWVEAEDELNSWNTIKLHWTVHPDRNKEWRESQDKLLGPSAAAQECDCDFITSGQSVVDGRILDEYKQKMCVEPMEKRGIDSNLWVWEQPNYTRDYVLVADVARGDSTDYSAFHVLDIDDCKQVAEYKGRMSTRDYGNLLVNVATEYNNALLVIENNNIGWATIQQAIDRDYDNLFYMSKDLLYVDTLKQVSNKIHRDEKKMIPGFTMSSKTRPLVVSKLEEFFREKLVKVYSTRLIDELFVFIYNGQRAEALTGYNDDLVISFGTALWIRETALRLRAEGIELAKKTISGINSQAIYTPNNKNDSWEWDIAGKKEDLTWLIK
jgi:hypothetical protein